MSLRRKKWEEWKRKEIEACPSKMRKAHRKLLDSVPMPTPEQEKRMEQIRRMVKDVFDWKKKGKHGKG